MLSHYTFRTGGSKTIHCFSPTNVKHFKAKLGTLEGIAQFLTNLTGYINGALKASYMVSPSCCNNLISRLVINYLVYKKCPSNVSSENIPQLLYFKSAKKKKPFGFYLFIIG